MWLGCLLVKESALCLSLAGVIHFQKRKKKRALADTALSFLQAEVLVNFSCGTEFITLGFSECKISIGVVKFTLEGSCSGWAVDCSEKCHCCQSSMWR